VKLEADSARTLDNCLWVIDRGYVDVPMWSIHRLGDGRHLFDTHVELVRFTISRADGTPRYAGLDVPADDTPTRASETRTWWRCWSTPRKIASCAKP